MGVGNATKLGLVREGYSVAEYIPYGTRWMPYLLRRLRENRRTLPLAVKSLLEKDI
jgi:proline dehydrogenase